MLDRASAFACPEIVALLKNNFVPLAIDQYYQRNQKDQEGELYRKIASQGPRKDFQQTSQGFYAATNSGRLLFYSNDRNPERLAPLMLKAYQEAKADQQEVTSLKPSDVVDKQYNPKLPRGGAVVRVHAKVLGGYKAPNDQRQKIFQAALSRDNLWISTEEHNALVQGDLLPSLQERIIRFHLVDNTRGEPDMWATTEIQSMAMKLDSGQLTGKVQLKTATGDRVFNCNLFGRIESSEGKLMRFDVVAKGLFRGRGTYTPDPPEGNFPLAISFTLADGSDVADGIPPQGSRGWLENYLPTSPAE